jgi:hypothetical protein
MLISNIQMDDEAKRKQIFTALKFEWSNFLTFTLLVVVVAAAGENLWYALVKLSHLYYLLTYQSRERTYGLANFLYLTRTLHHLELETLLADILL